ncbi:LUD domain-containing protein [Candidatus Gottesmanbacteria bacterium]|nr:LUD domain-containing protein [Candidatus Gottesmanbacteria bacterium]
MAVWDQLASDESIDKTVKALMGHGIEAFVVETRKEAKKKVLDMIPARSEVMTMTSVTLDAIGLSAEINRADGKFKPVRDKLYAMDRKTQAVEMNRLGAAPEVALGSVHAVTQDGSLLIASATGSQLPAYVYGAGKVIWVAGSQKIVKDTNEGMRRIYEYVFPLENERAKKAYGVGSGVNKLLIIHKEIAPGRMTLIVVKEKLGF